MDALSLEIRAGSVYGLLGPNAAGKTTPISMIAGLLEPDDGEIVVAGQPMTTHARRAKDARVTLVCMGAAWREVRVEMNSGLRTDSTR